MYGGVRGRKTRVGEKLHRFPPTRFIPNREVIVKNALFWAYVTFWVPKCGLSDYK